jgi:hypothetical protein
LFEELLEAQDSGRFVAMNPTDDDQRRAGHGTFYSSQKTRGEVRWSGRIFACEVRRQGLGSIRADQKFAHGGCTWFVDGWQEPWRGVDDELYRCMKGPRGFSRT